MGRERSARRCSWAEGSCCSSVWRRALPTSPKGTIEASEIWKRFHDIVEFAELGHAVDRQVKYYSSGMQMRLGFGVAAFLQPDVLLVDEVLAVGDATFQQRCLDRIRTVLAEGATLVFVSHDLAAVEATCANGVWIHNGVIQSMGPIREVLGNYRGAVEGAA